MLTVQFIHMDLDFTRENFAIYIALLSFVVSCWNSWNSNWNSRKAFSSSNYPKIKAELYLSTSSDLPIHRIYNESDKIIANNIQIKTSIRNWSEFFVFKGKWFTYRYVRLARLKPLESCLKEELSGEEIVKWCQDRGYEEALWEKTTIENQIKRQKIYSTISTEKSYDIRLLVSYTSNAFGANRTCRISKKYKLISHSTGSIHPEDKFCWELIEK